MAKGKTFFLSSKSALCPTQTSFPWVLADLSLGTKQPGHEADKSPPSSGKVKKEWSYTSTPAYTFTVHMGNLTFSYECLEALLRSVLGDDAI
jgi:hypothetical protein